MKMKNLLLLAALIATPVMAAELPFDTTIPFPSGPQGQVTTPWVVDVVATRVDLNGTITGQAEYIAYYAGGTRYSPKRFCADIYRLTWDVTGTLVSSVKTSVGCAANRVGVFNPLNAAYIVGPVSVSFGVFGDQYNRTHWAAVAP
jgi:hypothetical protein